MVSSISWLVLFTSVLSVYSSFDVVSNDWHVVLKRGQGPQQAREIAQRNGFHLVGSVMNSDREYHFKHHGLESVSTKRSVHHTRKLKADPEVHQAIQQTAYIRHKRGYKHDSRHAGVKTARERFRLKDKPNDPLYSKEWYLHNTGQAGGVPDLDLNTEAAWAQGITGKGVTTAIMDDGIDYMHPDLYDNFNAEASYDFSSNDPFPYPRYTDDWFNSHGTRCAGEIAAKHNNHLCGVGVAYGSKIAGLRMLDQPYMTDLIEANSMGYKPDLIDIYSASWGPTDDGKTVDGPRNLTMRAIVNGVNKGRKGKGNIYVWASGDGGPSDDCNCDGYAASMWTVSINSATNDGQTASYDESCSSTLASTFSNGKAGFADAGVATTDLYGNCTLRHSGTSAAAPEAAGVFALALEANPDLTWRDLQHLVVLTSKRNHLHDPHGRHDWQVNGAGLEFNHLFGYGVLDAGAIVELSKEWQGLPERFHCTAGSEAGKYKFSRSEPLQLEIDTNGCQGQEQHEVNYLEHVQAFITVKADRRGDIMLYLTSPMGTKTMILSQRKHDDDSKRGFVKWPFMTTHTWAENPRGKWILRATINGEGEGVLSEWNLVIHGTQAKPYDKQLTGAKRNAKLAVVKAAHKGKRFIQED